MTIVYGEHRRHAALGLTKRKHDELREIARRSARTRQRFVAEYWAPAHAASILWSPRRILRERRRSGWGETGLSVHQTVMVLEDALGTLRGRWRAALAETRRDVSRHPNLSADERHWLRYVMTSRSDLDRCLRRELIRIGRPWAAGLNEDRLAIKLRRLLLRRRGRMPRLQNQTWFRADTNLYRVFTRPEDRWFRGAWLAITGTRPGRRICIPLAGRSLDQFAPRTAKANSRPHLRVEVADRAVFHIATRMEVRPRDGLAAGVDKGYRTLLTLSTGDPASAQAFGSGAHAVISDIADTATERLKNRRRLAALARSMCNTAPAKARRIRRNNLGRVSFVRRRRSDRVRLRDHVNGALNEMFETRPDIGTLVVEDLRSRPRALSHTMNRRLGRWIRGFLHHRLAYKSELNGVELQVVNAAYTSQMCPRCCHTAAANRRGDLFECRSCGYSGLADAVAATNVLTRGSDPDITLFTRKERVKEILEGRWRTARSGRARDSNPALRAVAGDPGRAANNRRASAYGPLNFT